MTFLSVCFFSDFCIPLLVTFYMHWFSQLLLLLLLDLQYERTSTLTNDEIPYNPFHSIHSILRLHTLVNILFAFECANRSYVNYKINIQTFKIRFSFLKFFLLSMLINILNSVISFMILANAML